MKNNLVAILLLALGVFIQGILLGVVITNYNLREDVKLCIEGHKPSCDKLEEWFRIKAWR